MIIRGIITSITRTAGKLKFWATGRTSETFSDRDIVQHFGFASNPPAGTSIVIINDNGKIVCLGSEKPSAVPAGNDWSVAVYKDNSNCILIKNNGDIVVKGSKILLGSDLETAINKAVDKRFFDVYNNHTHILTVSPPTATGIVSPASQITVLNESTVTSDKVKL